MKNTFIFLIVAGTFSAQVNAAETLLNLQDGIFVDLVDTSTSTTFNPCTVVSKISVCGQDFN